jgi:hypothetical protein
MFGVKIEFIDGRAEWFDPVEEEPVEVDGIITVDNGYYSYTYKKSTIKSISKYDLCPVCMHDVDSCGCYEKCINP